MTNYEHYKEQINPYIVSVVDWGLIDGKIRPCEDASCAKCTFWMIDTDGSRGCYAAKLEWVGTEYKEPRTDWSKVPVDAKILVSDDGKEWYHAHFAYFDDRYKKVRAWDGGGTRWTCDEYYGATGWDYAKLAEVEHD